MRQSQLFTKTRREAPKDEVSKNAQLLIRAGYIHKEMAGVYAYLPLGLRVVEKIKQIVREEMNATQASEILMPLLHPKEIWNETGRWEAAKEVMYQFKKNDKEFALSFTHEEVLLDLVRKNAFTYRDYPVKLYHFSTKFRNEPRAKSGLLRGREFIMKDLYSLHKSEEEFDKYYQEVSDAYKRVFKRLGFDVKITEAGGGEFTKKHSHEFQVLADSGEDKIIYCQKCDFAENEEISKLKEGDRCPKCGGNLEMGNSIEVGNIFSFGKEYSEKMNVTFTSEKGEKLYPFFGSYGIGITRAMATSVELFHDDRGIIWPKEIAPYSVYLIDLVKKEGEDLYKKLEEATVEVLYDDRDVSAGEKFATADLLGIPYRLVLSEKTGDKIEFKERNVSKAELLTFEEVIGKVK